MDYSTRDRDSFSEVKILIISALPGILNPHPNLNPNRPIRITRTIMSMIMNGDITRP